MSINSNQWFLKAKNNTLSQFGEDGIITEIFDQIGTKNKFVIECGAADGKKNSNARALIADKSWSGLMIEGNVTDFETLVSNYQDFPGVVCANRFVSFEGTDQIEKIFLEYNIPSNPDLFILDIDGNEYHIWSSMAEYRPRVMVVEFNQTIPNDTLFIQPRDMSIQQGSSLKALVHLGKEKKYRLVAVTDVNAFFVCDEHSGPFQNLQNDLDTLRPTNKYETKLFQLYDGTLKISGNNKLIWHDLIIDEDAIQILSPTQRIYKNGISHRAWVRKFKHRVRKSKIYPLVRFMRKNDFLRRIIK